MSGERYADVAESHRTIVWHSVTLNEYPRFAGDFDRMPSFVHKGRIAFEASPDAPVV